MSSRLYTYIIFAVAASVPLAVLFSESAAGQVIMFVWYGVLAAWVGYRIHFTPDQKNPYFRVRPFWGIPKTLVLLAVSAMTVALGLVVFLTAIQANDIMMRDFAISLALANSLYCFGTAYGLAGWIATNNARQTLRRISFQEKQRLREEFVSQQRKQWSFIDGLYNLISGLSLLYSVSRLAAQAPTDGSDQRTIPTIS